jgi:hydrogenase expression/formation protein HypE
MVAAMIAAGIDVHCMRDLTRGGLASALVEIAESCGRQIQIEETRIGVREDVRGACEILGFDPMYLANEGRFVAFVAESDAAKALEIMYSHPGGENASRIGTVADSGGWGVTLKSRIGASRVVDMFTGEQLPRIC